MRFGVLVLVRVTAKSHARTDLLRRMLVGDHPRRAELVPEHSKARGEKSLLHRHEDLAVIGEQSIDAFCFGAAINGERKIGAAHSLETIRRYVASHNIRPAERQPRVKNCFLLIGRNIARARLFAMGHHHRDLSAEMLLVKTKSLLAVTAVVQIGI